MPRGDRTGPEGLGPMTGRGLGYCAGFSSPGFTKGSGLGLARGRGRGIGRGLARGYRGGRGPGRRMVFPSLRPVPIARDYPSPYLQREPSQSYYREYTEEEKIEELREYANYLKEELEAVEKRIDEISE